MDTSCHIVRLSLISLVILVGNSKTQEITCLSAQTCGECISLAGCSWCSDPSRDNFLPRCDFADLIVKNCPSEHNYNPANEVVTDVNNDTATENDGNILNIVPKKVALKLRPNTTSKIRLRIEQTSNYPVDLYYLMDLTHSMKDHKETLSVLAEELGIEMANITGNFRLGFGSFIDKVVMPFANMLPEKLINPCSDGAQCVPPYGFRNHLSLTDNLTLFVNEVRSASLSANLDNAEGGFDALMQVLMCVDQIGWKPQHRRIILFATDSIFHYAGDGKLGGIVKPNDGQCHLDKNGYYSETLRQDYPSLEQINRAITQQDVNIIFAVPGKAAAKVYKELSQNIAGAQSEEMDDNSSNIIQLIRRNYDKISSNIELSDDAPKSVKIKYFAKCDIDDEWIESNECDEFKVGDTIEFELEITATSCAFNSSERFNFAVSPVGLREESHFEIEVICECPCEQSPAIQSEHCTARGNLVCGTCVCEEGRYGGKCECDGNTSLAADMLQKCKRPSDDGKLSQSTCSGRGDCECGQCICSSAPTKADKIFGPFCECDTFSCGKDASGQSCGGPSRGQCCDGHCQCQEGWTGESCDCTTNTTECISPNGQICSGHGRCECGKCKCSQDEETGIYAGTFCEQCLTCAGKCVELEDCVRCRFPGLVVIGSDEGVLNVQDCEARCSRNDFVIVDDLSESTLSENNTNIRLCKFSDGDGCQMEFSYDFDFVEERASVTLSKKRECPSPVNMWLVIATIAGSILLIGILLVLLLRLLVYLKDKRDYAKWKSEVDQIKETKLQTMSPNPLYREANTKYQNPLYDSATTST